MKVYSVPLVSPVTVQLVAVVVQVFPPGFAVTVYEVTGASPAGTNHVTVASESPASAVGDWGTPGAAIVNSLAGWSTACSV